MAKKKGYITFLFGLLFFTTTIKIKKVVIIMLFQSDEGKEPLTVEIHTEVDIVEARQKGRMFSNCLGFSTLDQARIITTISELSRNIYKYATTGKIIMETIENQPRNRTQNNSYR